MTTSRGNRKGPPAPGPTPPAAGERHGPAPDLRAPHAPRSRAPRTPPPVRDNRRYLAAGIDCYCSLVTSGLIARPQVRSATAAETVGLLLGPAIAFSFLNQVVLTAVVGAGVGKLIMGIRVIGLPGAGRPAPGPLVRQWFHGLYRLPLHTWYVLLPHTRAPSGRRRHARRAGGCGGPAELRQVLHSDLLAHRHALAGRV